MVILRKPSTNHKINDESSVQFLPNIYSRRTPGVSGRYRDLSQKELELKPWKSR